MNVTQPAEPMADNVFVVDGLAEDDELYVEVVRGFLLMEELVARGGAVEISVRLHETMARLFLYFPPTARA
jgi:hypothetical protein